MDYLAMPVIEKSRVGASSEKYFLIIGTLESN